MKKDKSSVPQLWFDNDYNKIRIVIPDVQSIVLNLNGSEDWMINRHNLHDDANWLIFVGYEFICNIE